MNYPKESPKAATIGASNTIHKAANGNTNYSRITPREQRLLAALLQGAVTREQADKICHASNSPGVVHSLRHRHLVEIKTEYISFHDYDGNASRYAKYWIDDEDKPAVRVLLRRTTNGTH